MPRLSGPILLLKITMKLVFISKKYLKKSYVQLFDKHLLFKYFLEIGFINPYAAGG